MPSKIIVRFKNDMLLKGTIQDFYANKDTFYLTEVVTNKGHVVELAKIKAVFFVKTFEGKKSRTKQKGFIHTSDSGTKTVVKFFDGEVIYGYAQDYSPYTKGFFLFPAEPDSNNTKVFIPHTSILELKIGEDIDKSVYADTSPKFLKFITPKTVGTSISVMIGEFPMPSGKLKIAETGETKEMHGEPVIFNLRPGDYTLEIIYESYTLQKRISVSRENPSIKIDLKNEMS